MAVFTECKWANVRLRKRLTQVWGFRTLVSFFCCFHFFSGAQSPLRFLPQCIAQKICDFMSKDSKTLQNLWANHSWFFLIGVKLIYNVLMVSAVQQNKSAIIIPISPPSWASFPFLHPIPLGHHRVPGWAPFLYSNFSSAIYFTHGSAMPLSPLVPSSIPPLCPQVHSLYLRLHAFPANKYHFPIFHIYAFIYLFIIIIPL